MLAITAEMRKCHGEVTHLKQFFSVHRWPLQYSQALGLIHKVHKHQEDVRVVVPDVWLSPFASFPQIFVADLEHGFGLAAQVILLLDNTEQQQQQQQQQQQH